MVYWQDPNDPARRRSVGELDRLELVGLRAQLGEPAPQAGGNPDDGQRGPDGRSAGP